MSEAARQEGIPRTTARRRHENKPNLTIISKVARFPTHPSARAPSPWHAIRLAPGRRPTATRSPRHPCPGHAGWSTSLQYGTGNFPLPNRGVGGIALARPCSSSLPAEATTVRTQLRSRGISNSLRATPSGPTGCMNTPPSLTQAKEPGLDPWPELPLPYHAPGCLKFSSVPAGRMACDSRDTGATAAVGLGRADSRCASGRAQTLPLRVRVALRPPGDTGPMEAAQRARPGSASPASIAPRKTPGPPCRTWSPRGIRSRRTSRMGGSSEAGAGPNFP